MLALILAWLQSRWAETESRAAVGAAIGALLAWWFGKIDTDTLELGLITAGVTFAMPGAVKQQVLDAIAQGAAGAKKALLPVAVMLGLGLSLAACQFAMPLAGAAAGSGALAAGLGAFDTGVTVLNDAEKTACAAQSGVNAAAGLAQALGKTTLAADLAKASTIAGKACVW